MFIFNLALPSLTSTIFIDGQTLGGRLEDGALDAGSMEVRAAVPCAFTAAVSNDGYSPLRGRSASLTASETERINNESHGGTSCIRRRVPFSSQVFSASPVGVTLGPGNLIACTTLGAGCPTFGSTIAIELEKQYVYSLVWPAGGLFESSDRSVAPAGSQRYANPYIVGDS